MAITANPEMHMLAFPVGTVCGGDILWRESLIAKATSRFSNDLCWGCLSWPGPCHQLSQSWTYLEMLKTLYSGYGAIPFFFPAMLAYSSCDDGITSFWGSSVYTITKSGLYSTTYMLRLIPGSSQEYGISPQSNLIDTEEIGSLGLMFCIQLS